MTLVPDDPAQATSDHGWDFVDQAEFLKPIVARLKKGGFRVSLFADADPAGVAAARDTGADRIELLHRPLWCLPFRSRQRRRGNWKSSARPPKRRLPLGLRSMPGTISSSTTCRHLLRRIPALAEVSIGHGLTADALEYGMAGNGQALPQGLRMVDGASVLAWLEYELSQDGCCFCDAASVEPRGFTESRSWPIPALAKSDTGGHAVQKDGHSQDIRILMIGALGVVYRRHRHEPDLRLSRSAGRVGGRPGRIARGHSRRALADRLGADDHRHHQICHLRAPGATTGARAARCR